MFAFSLLTAPSAGAEEVFTGQATAANATDTTWIAPPPTRAAVCIVDSGNDANPDTTNVVARYAATPEDGGGVGDVSSQKHGTLMSMIAAAPYNAFGMVGAAPSIDVVSVRVMSPNTSESFGLADILRGVQLCQNKRSLFNIKVISLSLGARHRGNLDITAESLIRDTIDAARQAGLNVVAAAGNYPGAVDWPAAYPTVFAIGAATNVGAPCAFAASGPEIDLWTSGCPQDVALSDGRAAWASGSSGAAAFTAAVLAQLRGLRPDLTPNQAEALLSTNARIQAAGKTLDAAAAFQAAGLGTQLAQGQSAIPNLNLTAEAETARPPASIPSSAESATVVADQVPAASTTTPQIRQSPASDRVRLPKPRVRALRVVKDILTFKFVDKPKSLQAHVRVYARKKGRMLPTLARSVQVMGVRVRIRVSRTLSEVSITYRDPTGAKRESAPLNLLRGDSVAARRS